MNVREYLSVRRAFALVRQGMSAEERITFEELAIACHLGNLGRPLRTSEIAEYQAVLRPTMTHRTGHLEELGLISREAGTTDRRSIWCSITEAGLRHVEALCQAICDKIKGSMPLSRCVAPRMQLVIDEMGSLSVSSSDLVLLGLHATDGNSVTSVGELVGGLGLLQPTVSMAVSSLEKAGLVCRSRDKVEPGRALPVSLTEAGREQAAALAARVDAMKVRRPRTA